ncbi:MAG TPA: SWIM zinc finger family protein [Rudaea sp.]
MQLQKHAIASSFWGKNWCKHLEGFSDYANRLPRGRSYVRSGAVCHLAISVGCIEAMVSGSSLYRVAVEIRPLKAPLWAAIRQKCSSEIESLLELLQGSVSNQVMRVVTDRTAGLFPQPGEMKFDCSCPDSAKMCKHVAAVLYGTGSRLDLQPQLLFLLRGVDPGDLIGASLSLPAALDPAKDRLADDQLSAIFGIDLLDTGRAPGTVLAAVPSPTRRTAGGTPPKTPARGRAKTSAMPNPGALISSDFDMTGHAVAALRKKHGLSVAEFAAQLSVAAASVQRWEATSGMLKLHKRCLAALAALQRQARARRSGAKRACG